MENHVETTQGQFDIEYHTLDGMSVSNRNFVLVANTLRLR